MKVAIVHDDLMRKGGAEQVALALHKTFPEAPIYTLCYQPNLTYPEFREATIITSPYQKFIRTENQMKRFFFPFGYWAMRMLKIEGYDKVILSSTFASKYASFGKGVEVINYCHNPFRIAWYPETYDSYRQRSGLSKLAFDFVLNILRRIDHRFTNNVDKTIVNSLVVKKRVDQVYGIKNVDVINPPVILDKFFTSNIKKDNYLLVSRFEPYKKVDLAIEVFNKLNKPLTIVGNGSQKQYLKSIAGSSITFKENLNSDELATEYAFAKAFIFPQEEDFGITPLEANASGTPVIAYGKGGVLETMIPYGVKRPTGLFFEEQSVESLAEAVVYFEEIIEEFKKEDMVQNVQRFSLSEFSKNIKAVVL